METAGTVVEDCKAAIGMVKIFALSKIKAQ